MKNKIILLFTLYVLLFVVGLVSCGDDCDGPFHSKYKTIGLDWFHYKVTYTDNSNTNFVLNEIENNSVLYNQYAISIRLMQETYAAQKSTDGNFSVYACDPVITHTTVERIDSIVITSTKNFNVNYPAGTNLSDLFDVVITDGIRKRHNLNNYIASKPFVPQQLILLLTERPQATTDFEFLVKYYQKGVDKNYFEFLTTRVVIQRN